MNPAEGIGSAGLGRGTELRGTKQRLLWLKYVGRFGRGVRGQEIPARSLSLEAMQRSLGFFFFFFFPLSLLGPVKPYKVLSMTSQELVFKKVS
jgi:hypothetical protein